MVRRVRSAVGFGFIGLLLFAAPAHAQVAGEPSSPAARLALRQGAQALFDEAGREFGVPPDLLRAYAYVHTRWAITQTAAERAPGHMPPIFGIMGLHDGRDGWFRDQVGRASELLGVPEDQVKDDTETNVRAAAALLRAEADALGVGGDDVEAWAPAVERITAIPGAGAVDRFARKSELYDVLATLQRGHDRDGIRIRARPVRLDRAFSPADLRLMRAPLVDTRALEPQAPAAAATADDPSALWNPTTCFSSRSSAPVTHVTIHMMQGYYGGTISWFKNCGNGVSAHYLLRSSDGQITQMVRESDMAWHVRASNPYTIGLEHEGFVHETSWYTTAMYEASAALTRRICQRHGIDRTKTYAGAFQGPLSDLDYKVKGHVHYANQTHTDPGAHWNWPRYRQLVASAAERNADVLDGESAVGAAIGPSQTRAVTVRVRNTGTRTWTAGEAFRLGAAADNGITWSGFRCGGYANGPADARAFPCQNVPPDGTHDFTFDVTAPPSGTAKLSLRMVQDGVAWFGEAFSWSMAVVATRAAEVVEGESQVPVALAPGESRSVAVRVRNTGSTTWTAGAAYRLGAMPENTVAWSSFSCGGYMNGPADGRAFLCQSVPPGAVHDFRLTVTAPASGTAVLGVRMVQDGVAWFGEGQAWAMTNACVQAVGAERWKGEYYANTTLTGTPVLSRDDGAAALSFDWGVGSPGPSCGVPADRFSARWTRTAVFPAGTYRFTAIADDGVRLYVDGALKLDKWIDQAPATYTVDVPLAAGSHTVRLDYYENGGGAVARLSWTNAGGAAGSSKLTIHTGFTGPLSMPFLRDAKPRLVKILDNFGPAAEVKAASPGTMVIGRIYEPTQPVDGDPGQRAQEWWTRNRDRILAHPAVDYWEGYNEPGVASRDAVAWYARFEEARVNLLAQSGKKACIGNFSTGTPDINDPGMWPAFYPAIDAARAHGGILGLHEYGTPMQQYFDTATGEGWLCARYRKVYRIHLVPDGRVLPLAITETGVDGVSPVGWKNHYTGDQYMEQLRWYDSILRQDPYVLGATIFSLEIPGWESFDVGPIVAPLTAHVRDTR